MATVHFTSHLSGYAKCGPVVTPGGALGDVLTSAIADNPRLRSYVLDDQGLLRRHVAVFVDGRLVTDRLGLRDLVDESSDVYVMQALSGG